MARTALIFIGTALWTLPIGLIPTTAGADNSYTAADVQFLASVAKSLVPVVDENAMDRIIADGHKVCTLMDAGQFDVIDPYIAYRYPEGPGSTYGLRIFSWEAAQAYCPWNLKVLSSD